MPIDKYCGCRNRNPLSHHQFQLRNRQIPANFSSPTDSLHEEWHVRCSNWSFHDGSFLMDSVHPTLIGVCCMHECTYGHMSPYFYCDQYKFRIFPFESARNALEMPSICLICILALSRSGTYATFGQNNGWVVCTFSRFLNGSYEITSASLQMNYVNMESYFRWIGKIHKYTHTHARTLTDDDYSFAALRCASRWHQAM